ncbi:hypothetical protein CPB86DRAFT_755084 [Serendipita vermifera]|nr:hypothetical protein CPB86DRAFT_755084 [Serendipita vermifera]
MSDIAVSPVTPATPLEPDTSKPSLAGSQSKTERTRKKLDLNQNKRGAFSVLLGTLSKAKKEDKQRNASEAAQKRALLEKRLHAKLARETTSVRRAEQAKRDRQAAFRKEEELAMKENLIRHRHRQLPNLARFLLCTDRIDTDLSSFTPSEILVSLQPPRRQTSAGGPASLQRRTVVDSTIFYLPSKSLPWQEQLIAKRCEMVKEAIEQEWQNWTEEKKKGMTEVENLKKQAEDLTKELPPIEDEEMDLKEDAEVPSKDNTTAPSKAGENGE